MAYLALVQILREVGDGVGGSPPRPDIGLPPFPSHPIVIPPDAIEPGVPTHPIYLPIYPSHPIVIPPDGLAPGVPTHPIYLPIYPSHPIVIPPDAAGPGKPEHPIVLPPYPDQGLPPFPSHPIAPGGQPGEPAHPDHALPPFPSHPIVIPPEAIVPDEEGKAVVIVYANTTQGVQRIKFTVEAGGGLKPPTTPQPKGTLRK